MELSRRCCGALVDPLGALRKPVVIAVSHSCKRRHKRLFSRQLYCVGEYGG